MLDLVDYYEKWYHKFETGKQPEGIETIIHLSENSRFFNSHLIAVMPHPRVGLLQEHNHDFLEFNYIVRGSCKNYVDGEMILLEEGDLLLMNTNAWHIAECQNPSSDCVYNILVSNSLLKEVQLQLHAYNDFLSDFFLQSAISEKDQKNYMVFRHNRPCSGYREITERIISNYLEKDLYMDAMLNGLFHCLLIELVRNFRSSTPPFLTGHSSNALTGISLNLIVQYIDENSQTITLEKLAAHFGYHPNYLSQMFQQESGMNFSSFLQGLRMKKAQQLLLSTNLPVHEIMVEVGYQNRTWFNKKFKEYYGTSPLLFRKSH